MPYAPKPGDPLSALDTPSMIVDLPLMDANIAKMMTALGPTGVAIRPHLKTTKSAALARRLVTAGCKGGCVAKLSEAEAILDAGFDSDLLITCEIVGPIKTMRLAELHARYPSSLRIVVDSEVGASGVNEALVAAAAAAAAGTTAIEPIPTLIDVDVGLGRTGVAPGEALALARFIRQQPLGALRIVGVQGYEGHLQHVRSRPERERACREAMVVLVSVAGVLRDDGFDMDVVTTGGTGTAEFCATVDGVTEVQPGSFIFMDTDYRDAVGSFFANSLTVLATVLSSQGPRKVTIDAGLKSLTTDSGLAQCQDPRYVYAVMGDEHGSLTWDEGTPDLHIGDRVEMVPSHIDPTINLHDVYYAYEDGVIREIWNVDSRGKVQ